mgnify:CR=1 FL=1
MTDLAGERRVAKRAVMPDVSPDSTGNRFRRARMARLRDLIEAVLRRQERCAIIDIGGTVNFWSTWRDAIDWSRVRVTCVNRDPAHASEGERLVDIVQGDARDLSDMPDSGFDLAFSNSVIEHVGTWPDMEAMAGEVRRVARGYLVQTPYYWFPIEPHARTPLLHWLPEPLAYRVVMNFRCGFWRRHDTVAGAVRQVQSARLIDRRQMAALFPDAEIQRERFFGLTKSLIAVRRAEAAGRDAA